jgi:hypothetical protein
MWWAFLMLIPMLTSDYHFRCSFAHSEALIFITPMPVVGDGPLQLLGLLSTAEAMGYPAVLRRGYQLLGNLSESVEVQQELVEAGVLQVVATGMRKNTKDPMVAQWGCFSLFHIMHMCPGVTELEKRRPGTLQALATETRDAMVAHKVA